MVRGVAPDDEATAYLIAEELIEQHGDDVGAFLEAKIKALRASKDFDQFSAWFVIRNAVAITLRSGNTRH